MHMLKCYLKPNMQPLSTFVVGYDNRSLADVFFTHKWFNSVFKNEISSIMCLEIKHVQLNNTTQENKRYE